VLTRKDLRHFRERLESERDAIKSRIAERSRDSRETVRAESGVGDSGDDATRKSAFLREQLRNSRCRSGRVVECRFVFAGEK
jgi:RNA polymerase-binding transcription factor DksA